MKKFAALTICLVIFVVGYTAHAKQAFAISLVNASASATTSRPSPSSPLSAADPLNAGSSTVTVFDNKSTFLSSDSAKFFKNGAYSETLTVATTSADKLTLFFTGNTANLQNKTSVIAVPITAMHTMVFTTQTAIPVNGTIEIAYPTLGSSDSNQASPSASGWMFNGLTTGNIKSTQGANCSWGISGTSANGTPKVTCTVQTSTIPAGTTLWVFLGCSTYTAGSTSCTTQAPVIINPTKFPTGTRGLESGNDVKNITVTTYSAASGSILDQSTLKMGTVESVFVVAHVDPTFSFRIDGVDANTDLNTVCSGLTSSTYNTGSFPSTPTEVNLGTVGTGSPNYNAQKMTITSNTGSGYTITATSSGFLLNPATGKYITNTQGNVTANNTPSPVTMPGGGGYGIGACDSNGRVNTTTWGTTAPKFANPSPSFYYTLVNYTGTLSTGSDVIYALYGAQALSTTPPGDYWQIVTYTASVVF